MYCYLCGSKAAIAQKTITYTPEGDESISVLYTHCGRQWMVNDKAIVTACGEAEAVEKGKSSADKEAPKA
jgi:hypothetical protein